MKRLVHNPSGTQRGSAIVEFSVIVTTITILLVGAVDFGRVYFHSISVANAAHSGAQYGAQTVNTAKDSVGIEAAVREDLGETVSTAPAEIATVAVQRYCECPDESAIDCDDGTCNGSAADRMTYVRVRVDKPFFTLIDYPGLADTINISREVHLRAR